MSDNQRKSAPGADLLGPILFIAGSFSALLVIGALIFGTPQAGAKGTGAVARGIVTTLGSVPALLLAVGMCIFGVRVFLSGSTRGVARHLSGFAGTAVGLAFLLGCFSATAGGAIGAASGGLLASKLALIPALLLGLATLAAPIWFTWLRDCEFFPAKNSSSDTPSDAFVATEPLMRSGETAVSAAEAEALLPDPEVTLQQRAVTEALQREGTPAWAAKDESTQPYPEDARLKGEIPEGATALEDPDASETPRAELEPRPAQGSGSRWTPAQDSGSENGVADDLVDATGSQPEPLEVAVSAQEKQADSATGAQIPEAAASSDVPLVVEGAKPLRRDANAPRPRWEAAVASLEKKVAQAERKQEQPESPEPSSANLWRPARETQAAPAEAGEDQWEYVEVAADESAEEPTTATASELDDEQIPEEQEDLLAPSAALEVELAEELEDEVSAEQDSAGEDSAGDDSDAEDQDEEWEYVEVAEGEEGWEEADEQEEEEEEEEDSLPAAAEETPEPELEEEEEEELDEDEEEWEYVEVAEGEEGWEDSEEIEEEEPAAAAAPREESEQDEDEWEYVEVAEGEDDWEEAEEAPELDAKAADEGSDDELYEQEFAGLLAEQESSAGAGPLPEVPAAAEVEVEAEPQPEPAIPASKTADEIQMDLFADPEPAVVEAPHPAPAKKPKNGMLSTQNAKDDESEEPIVVLTPQPAGASADALRAAEVILSEQRVAVSILQRSCGLDFKQSCVILDELQELGFIGPYVDGNSRDILMGREQWLSTVGTQ